MPEDEATEQPQPAQEPVAPILGAPDAPPAPERLLPGQSMFGLSEHGLRIVTVTQPQAIAVQADKETMRQIVSDWLARHDEEFWDVLVKARIETLRQRQKNALHIVTDAKTIRRVNKSKQGVQA